jgi:general secretion pathway protein B
MSYILEALRRAESERERKRGGVPGLHAKPVPMPSPDDIGEHRSKPWVWLAGCLSVGVLLMILWRWSSMPPLVDEDALARAPVGGNVSQGSADAPAAAPAPTTAPAEPAPQATPSPAPAPAPKSAASSAAPDKPPRSSRPAPPPRSTAAAAATPLNPPPPASSPAAAQAKAPAPAAPPPERLRTLAELPDDLRRSVPQLAFGGSVYSDTPAQRMVIFNGQVMREGDAVSEELQIEQIRPRSTVLRVRGQRFEMPF